jgi:hypothetical protein
MKRILVALAVLLTFAIGAGAQAADNSTAGKRVSATFQPPAQATKVAATADKAKTVAKADSKKGEKAAGKSGTKKTKKKEAKKG